METDMAIGLHNVSSEIWVDLTKCKPGQSGPDSVAVGESGNVCADSDGTPVYHNRSLEWARVCEFFIYLAATPNNQIVKVGLSTNPERRLPELLMAKRAFGHFDCRDPGGFDMLQLRLVRSWSLGQMDRRSALKRERAVHLAMADVRPPQWGTEWYRLATSKAATVIGRTLAVPA
jgi:hypothetical protein